MEYLVLLSFMMGAAFMMLNIFEDKILGAIFSIVGKIVGDTN